MTMSLVTSV